VKDENAAQALPKLKKGKKETNPSLIPQFGPITE
jgi:hypothetical protein